MSWFTASKQPISFDEICTLINSSITDIQVTIGTDSYSSQESIKFVSVICLVSTQDVSVRKYFYTYFKVEPYRDFYTRIFKEAEMLVDLGNKLKQRTNCEIHLHLDVSSPELKHKTSKYTKSLVSYVKAFGFTNVKIKPNSWVANSIADKHTK